MTASVADELLFERLLDAQSPEARAAIERVLAVHGYKSRISQFDVQAAYQRGRADGQAAERREQKQREASK